MILSGRDISFETAIEFMMSLGGVFGVGYVFRIIAQQGSKLINIFWPGAGSAISAGVAEFGTNAIGKAAVAYYIDGTTLDEAKRRFETETKKPQ